MEVRNNKRGWILKYCWLHSTLVHKIQKQNIPIKINNKKKNADNYSKSSLIAGTVIRDQFVAIVGVHTMVSAYEHVDGNNFTVA